MGWNQRYSRFYISEMKYFITLMTNYNFHITWIGGKFHRLHVHYHLGWVLSVASSFMETWDWVKDSMHHSYYCFPCGLCCTIGVYDSHQSIIWMIFSTVQYFRAWRTQHAVTQNCAWFVMNYFNAMYFTPSISCIFPTFFVMSLNFILSWKKKGKMRKKMEEENEVPNPHILLSNRTRL